MAERRHLRPRPALHPTLAATGLAVMRVEVGPEERLGEHGHDVLELAWVERGGLDHRVDARSYPGRPGSLLVIPHGCVHRYEVLAPATLLWNLVVDRDRLPALGLPRPLAPHLDALLPSSGGAVLLVEGVDLAAPMRGLFAEQERRAVGWQVAMAAQARLLFLAAARVMAAGGARPASAGDARIEALRRRLEDQPALDWSLGRMAREAGLGGSGLLRAFVRHAGCTPMAYLRQARLRAARSRIEAGASVAEAARAAGYGSAAALIHACRRSGAGTPGAWRR